MPFVCLGFHVLLRTTQVLLEKVLNYRPLVEPCLQSRDSTLAGCCDFPMAWFMAKQSFDRRHADAGVERRIVLELGERYPVAPAVRACMDEASEVCFHALIDAFRLAICLGVIR